MVVVSRVGRRKCQSVLPPGSGWVLRPVSLIFFIDPQKLKTTKLQMGLNCIFSQTSILYQSISSLEGGNPYFWLFSRVNRKSRFALSLFLISDMARLADLSQFGLLVALAIFATFPPPVLPGALLHRCCHNTDSRVQTCNK